MNFNNNKKLLHIKTTSNNISRQTTMDNRTPHLYEYQCETGENSCPPNKILPNDLFQSENFRSDPLSGFNSMTSSYSSQHGNNSDDHSPTSSIEHLDSMICVGKERGYFSNPIIVDYPQDQRQQQQQQQPSQHYYVPYTEQHFYSETNVTTSFEVSDTIIIENKNYHQQPQEHHQHIYYENASVGSRSYSSDQNGRSSSPENCNHENNYQAYKTSVKTTRQISQDIGDILVDVDDYIRNSSSSNSPGSDQTWTPEIQNSPPPIKKQKMNNKNISIKEEEEIQATTSTKKERRKATNRKASANYRAKQVKSRNAKGARKQEQEEIQKKLELDNHAVKMQIEYMMKTFCQRIKQTQ